MIIVEVTWDQIKILSNFPLEENDILVTSHPQKLMILITSRVKLRKFGWKMFQVKTFPIKYKLSGRLQSVAEVEK